MFRFYIQPELGEVLSILFSLRLASLCFSSLLFQQLRPFAAVINVMVCIICEHQRVSSSECLAHAPSLPKFEQSTQGKTVSIICIILV